MAVAFSPDGQYLAYSDVDNSNRVDLASPNAAQFIRTIDWMQGPIWEFFISPDGSMLAAADGIEIRIWRVKDGRLFYVGGSACP